ncbi:MAG TPA: chemotaxis protein CheW [Chthoniobacteraceae bacterium]|jgi:purine-binding chemotaxis protein CheW|nr:chemotaxis protein CheW [Chthoniobacteraceae bacterium]
MSSVDWEEIRRRLERSTMGAEGSGTRSPDEVDKILKARARALAREQNVEAGQQVEVIEFLLAYEKYAVEFDSVREVYPMKDITPVPGTPPFVVGIVNVRGRIVSVIDLKKFFDLPAKGLPDLNRVIIIGNDEIEFGLLAEFVTGVRRISLEHIQPAMPTLSGVRADYLKGMTPGGLALLDAEKLLSNSEIRVCQSAEV